MKLSILELRMLLLLVSDLQPATGKGIVKYVRACRNLEKKGLAVKGRLWCATRAGVRFVERAMNATDFELTEEEKHRLADQTAY